MKKRVTLVTWLGYGNYGTSLQSFALYYKLQAMGCSVRFLSHYSKFCTHSILNWLKNCLLYIRFYTPLFYQFSAKGRKLRHFHSERYVLKSALTSWGQKSILRNTDVFVAGSDQIWNVTHAYSPFMFLDFAQDKKRVAYASSIGTSEIEDRYKTLVKQHLQHFAAIGVREKTAVKTLNDLLGEDKVVQVLDPTFLLSASEWKSVANDSSFDYELPERYVLCYFIGNNPEYKCQLEEVLSKSNIKNCIIIPSEETSFIDLGNFIYDRKAGPKEFVKLIEGAAFVCTDSFHATTISLILSKQFVVFKRFSDRDKKSQNSRIHDVLELVGLSDRFYPCDIDKNINYKDVQHIVDIERKKSEKYIMDNILT